MTSRHLRRNLKALWRDTRVLVRQFRFSLLAFVALLAVGSTALRCFYTYPDTGLGLTWAQALHTTFMLIFAENTIPFPQTVGLQILFFVIPPVGLAVVADGVLRFGVGLFDRHQRKEAWQMAIASTYRDHVIVCGLGRIGYRVVHVLLRLGEEVVGIEQDANGPFLEQIRQMQVPVLLGDARQQTMLEQARVRDAAAIVVCTQDDLTNLAIALDARALNPNVKVVLRMFDAQLAEKVRSGFGIHTAFSTSALAAPVFAAAATRAQIDHSFYVDDMLMNVAHTTVQPGSALVGYTVERVEQELDMSVILYKGVGMLDTHPAPNVVLRPDDYLMVLASLEALARLRQINCPVKSEDEETLCPEPRRRSSWLAGLTSKHRDRKRRAKP
jgi:Trk K+ transport system NAD-binding subunit